MAAAKNKKGHYGGGGIRPRTSKSGTRYQASIFLGHFADGTENRPNKTFASHGEARAWLSEMSNGRGKTIAQKRKRRVSELLDDYIEHQRKEKDKYNLRPQTYDDYVRVNAKLRKVLPDVEVAALTFGEVVSAMTVLATSYPGHGTRRRTSVGGVPKLAAPRKATAQEANRALYQLRRVLAHGETHGWLDRNVARLVKPINRGGVHQQDGLPEAEKIWNLGEVQKLLTAARDNRLYAMLYLMLSYGCRIGEMMALRWSDLDLERGRLTVSRSYHPRHGFGPPKGKLARTITISAQALAVLREHGVRQQRERVSWGAEYLDEGLVFCSVKGTPLNHSNVRRAVDLLIVRAGVPRRTIHAMRHTAASALIRAGYDVGRVAAILGHKDATVTLKTYTHAFREMDNQDSEDAHTLYGLEDTAAKPQKPIVSRRKKGRS